MWKQWMSVLFTTWEVYLLQSVSGCGSTYFQNQGVKIKQSLALADLLQKLCDMPQVTLRSPGIPAQHAQCFPKLPFYSYPGTPAEASHPVFSRS
jgi:hypothetical protein